MRPFGRFPSERLKSGFDVDQSGDDGGLGVVRAARVAVPLRHDAEPLAASDTVLDSDAEAAQAAVVLLLLLGQFAFLGPEGPST
jgi:hypothetical protein